MPYVSVCIELDDIDTDDLVEELESRGYSVSKSGTERTEISNLEHVEHLALCGLMSAAQQEALKIVGAAIGRAIH